MDVFSRKESTSSHNLTYNYYHSPPVSSKKLPNLLFLHGFLDSAEMWSEVAPRFHSLGYGVLAPDILGFGGSLRPTDPELYNYEDASNDYCELLDHDDRIIVIDHNWGSAQATPILALATRADIRRSHSITRLYPSIKGAF